MDMALRKQIEKTIAKAHKDVDDGSIAIRPYATGFLVTFTVNPKKESRWCLPEDRVAFFNGGGNLAWDMLATVYHPELTNRRHEWSGYGRGVQ